MCACPCQPVGRLQDLHTGWTRSQSRAGHLSCDVAGRVVLGSLGKSNVSPGLMTLQSGTNWPGKRQANDHGQKIQIPKHKKAEGRPSAPPKVVLQTASHDLCPSWAPTPSDPPGQPPPGPRERGVLVRSNVTPGTSQG